MWAHFQKVQIKIVYQGHRVKVKVTGTKSVSEFFVRGWSAFDCQVILLVRNIMRPTFILELSIGPLFATRPNPTLGSTQPIDNSDSCM